jgi:hypothetical protein
MMAEIVQHIFQETEESTKYVYIKSTTVYVPSSEMGLSLPLSPQQVCPSPQNRRERHTRLRVRGWGSPNSDERRKSLALCLLCGGKLRQKFCCSLFPNFPASVANFQPLLKKNLALVNLTFCCIAVGNN